TSIIESGGALRACRHARFRSSCRTYVSAGYVPARVGCSRVGVAIGLASLRFRLIHCFRIERIQGRQCDIRVELEAVRFEVLSGRFIDLALTCERLTQKFVGVEIAGLEPNCLAELGNCFIRISYRTQCPAELAVSITATWLEAGRFAE